MDRKARTGIPIMKKLRAQNVCWRTVAAGRYKREATDPRPDTILRGKTKKTTPQNEYGRF